MQAMLRTVSCLIEIFSCEPYCAWNMLELSQSVPFPMRDI